MGQSRESLPLNLLNLDPEEVKTESGTEVVSPARPRNRSTSRLHRKAPRTLSGNYVSPDRGSVAASPVRSHRSSHGSPRPRFSRDGSRASFNAAESKFELDSIQTDLQAYCRSLAKDLNDGTGIAAKYYAVPPVRVISDAQASQAARIRFIDEDFTDFFAKLMSILEKLPKEYIYEPFKKAILTKDITKEVENIQNAQLFRDYVNLLNKAGFYSANGKPVTCWCGPNGKKAAYESKTALADGFVPSISVLSELGSLLKNKSENPEVPQDIQEKYRLLSDKVFLVCSAELACQATGNVYMYSDATNKNETMPRFLVKNFFDDVELPLLQTLRNKGVVASIFVVDYLPKEEKPLQPPIDINSAEYKHKHRYATRHDSLVGATSSQKRKDKANWQEHGAERLGAKVSTVASIFSYWYKKTKDNLNKAQAKPSASSATPAGQLEEQVASSALTPKPGLGQ